MAAWPVLACALALAAPPPAAAQAVDPPTAETIDVSPPTSLEQLHESVKLQLREAARMIDGFFSDAEYDAVQNDSGLRLRFDTGFEAPNDFALRFAPRLRLRLPGTGKRLLFEAEGGGETSHDGDNTNDGDLFTDLRDDDDFELRLRYIRELDGILLAPEIGVGFRKWTPRAFAGGRVRRYWRSDGDWRLHLSERLRVYTDVGVESVTKLEADRLVFGDSLFRAGLELEWQQEQLGVTYGPRVALYRPLDDRSAIGLEGAVDVGTRPEHEVDEAAATLRYRRRMLTDWSIVEVAPRVMFKEKDDYRASFGILLRLELDF
jgi:hypothetical protein